MGYSKAIKQGKPLKMKAFTPIYEDLLQLLERKITYYNEILYTDTNIRETLDLLLLIDISRQSIDLTQLNSMHFDSFGYRSISFISYPKYSFIVSANTTAPTLLRNNLNLKKTLTYKGRDHKK